MEVRLRLCQTLLVATNLWALNCVIVTAEEDFARHAAESNELALRCRQRSLRQSIHAGSVFGKKSTITASEALARVSASRYMLVVHVLLVVVSADSGSFSLATGLYDLD